MYSLQAALIRTYGTRATLCNPSAAHMEIAELLLVTVCLPCSEVLGSMPCLSPHLRDDCPLSVIRELSGPA